MLNLNLVCHILIALLLHCSVQGQDYEGIYGDWTPNGDALVTQLELKNDGNFTLRTVDYVYPQTRTSYINKGKWISNGKEITLNPNLKKREPKVKLKEGFIGLKDSIEIKINHYVTLFENQQLIKKTTTEFDLLTLYFNKKRKYVHLTRADYTEGSCAWAPRIRNRIIVDSSNRFRIAKKDLNEIGVFTYGFTKYIPLTVKNKKVNYFEIDIIMPIDRERMPRNKKVIIKGNRAFFYEQNGKVATFWGTPLRKKLGKKLSKNTSKGK